MVQNFYDHSPRPAWYYPYPRPSMSRSKEFDPEAALDRALDLFWRRGYEGASLRDLLEHMDIPRQSLYDTFGDKRSLFLKVLTRYEQLMMEGLFRLLEHRTTVTAIRGFFETFLAEVVLTTNRGSCLMANTAIEVGTDDPEIHAAVRTYFARVEETFYTVLAGTREIGQLPEGLELRPTARHLVNSMYGLGIMGRAGVSRLALRQMVDVALSVLKK
jgi:TetR/AcrR family transcriptional repressor of nem operon